MLLAIAFIASCSDGDAESGPAVLPLGDHDPRAYTEDYLVRHPRAALQPGHIAVLRLRATGEEGLACDDGVVCLPYHLTEQTELTLSVHDSSVELAGLDLVDPSGLIALQVPRDSEPVTAMLDPGRHLLRLHHRHKGRPEGAEETLFVRPLTTAPRATGGPRTGGTAAVAAIEATRDCQGCDFFCSDLSAQRFDGAALDGSCFADADLTGASFVNASLTFADFEARFVLACQRPGGGDPTDLTAADFTAANLAEARFGGARGVAPTFARSHMTETRWVAVLADPDAPDSAIFLPTRVTDADFRAATLDRSHFAGATLDEGDFRGADLSRAVFDLELGTPDPVDLEGAPVRSSCVRCKFGPLPPSDVATRLGGAVWVDTDLTDADFTGADLTAAVVERTTLAGADFTGANLTSATLGATSLDGARFAGAVLADLDFENSPFIGASFAGANLAGLPPTLFNDRDLTRADFSAVDFGGFDLTRADLSRSIISAATSFARARLSDGVGHGVNLSGLAFPAGTTQLKGADLSFATLDRVQLFEADLDGVVLHDARLIGANLNFANLRRARLVSAQLGVAPGSGGQATKLRGVFMIDADLTDADLRSADLTGAHLYGDTARSLFVRTQLDSAVLEGAIVSGAVFSGSLSNAVFNNAQAVNTVFNGANLTNAKFNSAYLQGADFSAATSVTGLSLSNAAVSTAPGVWQYMERDGTPFVVQYGATQLGAVAVDATVICPNGDSGGCVGAKLTPVANGPFPPQPPCVPTAPRYDNCLARTPTPGPG